MIPLRDDAASRRLTAVNTLLIVANLAVYAYEVSLGNAAGAFIDRYAMVPERMARLLGAAGHAAYATAHPAPAIVTPVTSMFLHGGILHIAGNMLYLFIFGAAVEEAMGHWKFLGFYFASGIAAALAMAAMMPNSKVPVIGASGAIAGVLGAYFVLFPRARVLTLMPLIVVIQMMEVPAVLYLLAWFALQLYWGVHESGQSSVAGGVAWWAHVGGFMFGVALGPLLARQSAAPRRRARRARG
jgi:membrane associated rhomboid family serine protease